MAQPLPIAKHGKLELLLLPALANRHGLITGATGTGKTDLICLYLKRLIAAGRAERILFLVDREQLLERHRAMAVILFQKPFRSLWLED